MARNRWNWPADEIVWGGIAVEVRELTQVLLQVCIGSDFADSHNQVNSV